jgi:pilus assembly protein CpaC
MEIQLGHSKTVVMDEEVVTAAFGNPDIASVVVVKPTTLLINAKAVGATSLTLFTRTGSIHNYRLLVSYDLAMLRSHLVRLDKGIKVDTDTNGKGIVLSGYVETKATITAAEVAAQRFFSQAELKIKRTPGNILENSTVAQNNKNEINKHQQAAQ